jgi:primary-amine oxidase
VKNNSFWLRSILLAGLVAAFTTPSAGQPKVITPCTNMITQNFPTTGPAVTTWTICWHEVAGNDSLHNPNGLVIGPVSFRKSPTSPFVQVLWDMRVSDYFVPYHPGTPRFYDLSDYNFVLTTVTAADCPPSVGGTLLPPPSGTVTAHVCQEIHDRGLMWKDSTGVRRGEELVLWGAIDAANYRYIQEYTFRDDGMITGRMGATGQNFPGDEHTPHGHNALWRIDIDLDGTANSAAQLQHIENVNDPGGKANDTTIPILVEEGFQWGERTHDMLEISNAVFKNAQNNPSTYHLIPIVTGGGLTQHRELFTQNDFWVTPYDATQFAARNLVTYVQQGRGVVNTDLVAWFKGSLHHHPRDEDGIFDHTGTWIGTTDVMWTGFMLMPNNVFDCSPFYRAACPQ